MKNLIIRIGLIGLSVLLICHPTSVYSQVKALAIGDTLSEMTVGPLVNGNGNSIPLGKSDHGKAVLIDFWSTWCSSCIAAFPKLQKLQEEFGDKLLIVPVTRQDSATIAAFWRKNKFTKELSLPTVIQDTLLHRYFPHRGVPHVVWLDRDLVVRAITNTDYVTAENIQKIIDNKEVDWIDKSAVIEYDFSKPLMERTHMETHAFPHFYATITGALKGTGYFSLDEKDSVNQTGRILYINSPIVQLYTKAVQGKHPELSYPTRQLILVRDSLRFVYDDASMYYNEWLANYSYCYEVLYPLAGSADEVMENMRLDLNRFLALNGRVERKAMACLELVKTDRPRMPIPGNTRQDEGDSTAYTYSIKSIVRSLNLNRQNPPVLLGDGIDGKSVIASKLTYATLRDIDSVRLEVRKYGYELKETTRQLDMLVIEER
ncbi:TlpA family protein disulfide reductase [Parapedobacter tibetensis]|uniref:TlpA family protein disulfide reductase n=1 Tax=Parapedobacter tibetensis TaxID=2972951 RepID=UPI00214D441E|nr:TlpA disulfide reductase family protein [Parapedobacter tibetensis]